MIGLKIRKDNLDLIDEYDDLFDFFEIYIDPGFPLKKLSEYSHKNITIHAAHFADGFDPSNPDLREVSKSIIDLAVKAADITGSPWIIVHPGHDLSTASKRNMINFFNKNWDDRIIFENCPAIDFTEDGLRYLFSLPDEMKFLIKKFNTGFVLDFGHAICTANTLKLDVNSLIKEFLELNPRCFHVSGISLNSNKDTHLHLFETDNKMLYLRGLDKNKYFTFETPAKDLRIIGLQKKDIVFFNNALKK